MASYIDPRCAVPTYLLSSEGVAGECGRIEGYVASFLLTLVILGISIALYFREDKDEEGNVVQKERKPLQHFGITFGIILAVWLGVPFMTSWLKKVNWRGYKEQIKSFAQKGVSEADAIKQIQEMTQAQMQARAITQGASTIAQAMRPPTTTNKLY